MEIFLKTVIKMKIGSLLITGLLIKILTTDKLPELRAMDIIPTFEKVNQVIF